MNEKDITLSIETAVHGGSLAVLRETDELDSWTGNREVSKSEDILEQIKTILKRNRLEESKIKKIVVSRGPGSYTGVRIGMALASGLKKALGCRLVTVSVLEALFFARKHSAVFQHTERVITAIPFGRNQICWQNFQIINAKQKEQSAAKFSTFEDFLAFNKMNDARFRTAILHRKLFNDFPECIKMLTSQINNVVDAGDNMAVFAGKAAVEAIGCEAALPIYIKDA